MTALGAQRVCVRRCRTHGTWTAGGIIGSLHPGDRAIRFDPTDGYKKYSADAWLADAVNPETAEPLNAE